MAILHSTISPRSAEFQANQQAMAEALEVVEAAAQQAEQGGGKAAQEHHLAKGKLLPRERVARLLDPGSPFLEVGRFAGHDLYEGAAPCAGVIAGVGTRVHGGV